MAKAKPRIYTLGIHMGHDASIAVFDDGKILFAIAEERLSRIKHHYGFPILSIIEAFEFLQIDGTQVKTIAFSSKNPIEELFEEYSIVELNGTVNKISKNSNISFIQSLKNAFKSTIKAPPTLPDSWSGFEGRHWSAFEGQLKRLGLLSKEIQVYFVSHHRAHAASAFRMNGKTDSETCVVTVDGKGDKISSSISLGHTDGRLELLRSSASSNSIGSFYQAVTEAIGFIPVDGEYKTMGLAALGENKGKNPFEGTIEIIDGNSKTTHNWIFRPFNEIYPDKAVPNPLSSVAQADKYKPLLEKYSKKQIAFFAQQHLEDTLKSFFLDALKISGSTNLVVAGGVMLNVKANSLIRDSFKLDKFFVYPDAADSGLAAGAALEALYIGNNSNRFSLNTPYLGNSVDNDTFYEESKNYYSIIFKKASISEVVKSITNGKVIGTFIGRMEMGPRALGNRSVIADPRTNEIKDRINEILKGREWFVPFAPIILESEAHKYYDGPTDYRYMTFAVEASNYAKKHVPGVVHLDGTMRPQIVTKSSNEWLFNLLTEFKHATGHGVLINTSFNRHGHAIVCRPGDALQHLQNKWVDAVVTEKHMYYLSD